MCVRGKSPRSNKKQGKPAPDPYLRGAELLKVDPARCTVFEDAPPGIVSAKAAGMRVIALTTTTLLDQLAQADAVVKDLTEIEFAVGE